MRAVRIGCVLALALLTIGAGDHPRGKTLDQALVGLVPGKAQDCLNNFPQTHTESYGSTILYKVDRSLVYRNDTTGGCEGMDRGDYIVTVSNSGRLCRGDIGRTYDPYARIPTGSCALGSFIPYARPRP